MHGVVFTKLKAFVEQRFDTDTWYAILLDAEMPDAVFVPIRMYPDEQLGAIATAAVKRSGLPLNELLESFGRFLAPHLMEMYAALIPKTWRTEELLLHVEDTIHRVVRMKNPGAEPPRLQFTSLGDGELQLEYTSKRRMEALARGIMLGIAEGYGEALDIVESPLPDGGTRMHIRVLSAA